MNKQQQQLAFHLVMALSSRNRSIGEETLIEKVKTNAPKFFARCEKMAFKVRKNVDINMLKTWEEQ